MADADGSKICCGCGTEKAFSEFTKVSKVKSGLSSQCKDCQRSKYHKNKHRFIDRRAAYYECVGRQKNADLLSQKVAENPDLYREQYAKRSEYIKAHGAQWRKANPELSRKRDAEQRAKHKAKRNETAKSWRDRNKDIIQALNWLRRLDQTPDEKQRELGYSRKHGPVNRAKRNHPNVVPAWADMRQINAIYEARDRLSLKFGRQFNVDHVVPLNNPLVCGFHTQSNLQLLDFELNIQKSNLTWPDMPE